LQEIKNINACLDSVKIFFKFFLPALRNPHERPDHLLGLLGSPGRIDLVHGCPVQELSNIPVPYLCLGRIVDEDGGLHYQLYFAIYFPHRTDSFSHMTARPIFPESWRRPVHAAVALVLVMVAVLLAAGCITHNYIPNLELDYIPNADIIIIKLTPNATVEWSRVLDSGGDDRAFRIIQTPDNNLAVYGSLKNENFVGLIKMSRATGDILWKTPLLENGCGSRMTLGRNGDIISTGRPIICRINSKGVVVWHHTIQMNAYGLSIIETPDNGYIVGGGRIDDSEAGSIIQFDENGNIIGQRPRKDWKMPQPVHQTIIAKIDAHGNVTWQTSLGRENLQDPVQRIIDTKQGSGYVVQTRKDVIRLDEDGNYLGVTHFYDLPEADNTTFSRQTLKKYITDPPDFLVDPSEVIFYDEQGSPVAIQTLRNVSHIISPTEDGGYISAGGLHIVKLNPDGTSAWETPVYGISVTDVVGIIQTSDGGYALLCLNE
jgi:hypothetical protein